GKSIAAIVAKALEADATQVEVTEEGERAWMELVDSGPEALLSSPDCTPGYYNNEGQLPTPADRRNAGGYPAGPAAYFDYINTWRSSGKFEGLEFLDD
ncbi:MAG: monooxygenase, partial [Deltaproteobacteria bacterium]|nr:monooxygenase [Deltaproteobacteria bacterium]